MTLKAIKGIINNGLKDVNDIEIIRRITLLNSICLIAIIHTIIFGSINVIWFNKTIGLLNYTVAAVLIIGQILLWKFSAYRVLMISGIFVSAILMGFLFVSGGIKNTGHLWYFIFPMFSTFLLGSKKGAIVSFLFLTPAILAIFINFGANNTLIIEKGFTIRFIVAYLLVWLFTFLFEKSREKTQAKLTDKNLQLEKMTESLMQTSASLEGQLAEYMLKLSEAEDKIKEINNKN